MSDATVSRRRFLAGVGGAAGLAALGGIPRPSAGQTPGPNAAAAAAGPAPAQRPNILLIVADDLGYGELGCYGGKDIPTPHIDSLAAQGVRCTSGYVSCPVCSPTRAGMLTGRYQQRFGHEFNPGNAAAAPETFGLPLTQKTLAERLRAAGYATGMVGKWHLGYRPQFTPPQRGFDEFFGFLAGAHPYLPDAAKGGGASGGILRGDQPVQEKEYLTDAFAREAVAFVDRHQAQPFFLYLPFNAVHAPMQASASRLARAAHLPEGNRRVFASMLMALDDAVGAVLKKLSDAGLDERTLVWFISDNGGPTGQTTSRNDPLGGVKGQVHEGGIRVPWMARFKGVLPAGATCDQPVIALDVTPTSLAAAGLALPPEAQFDGVDLLPLLSGRTAAAPHEALYWRFGAQWAVRQGDWKLLNVASAAPKLFNLASDVGEKTDLAAQQPEKVAHLQAAYDRWNAQNIPPAWGGRGGGKAAKAAGAGAKGAGKAQGAGAKAGKKAKAAPPAQ